jgi:hypothetical protein
MNRRHAQIVEAQERIKKQERLVKDVMEEAGCLLKNKNSQIDKTKRD